MITRQNLIDARNLIADRRHWIKGTRKLYVGEGEYAYCAIGALDAVTGRHLCREQVAAPFQKIGISDIVGYNDYKGHACTVAAFDAAIEKYDT